MARILEKDKRFCSKAGHDKDALGRKHNGYCLECGRQYNRILSRKYFRKWREKNKDRENLCSRARFEGRRDWLWTLKTKPCMDCHHMYHPAAMQYDHVRGKKEFMVNAHTVSHYSEKSILAELEKCDLVCANCHFVRTWERRQP